MIPDSRFNHALLVLSAFAAGITQEGRFYFVPKRELSEDEKAKKKAFDAAYYQVNKEKIKERARKWLEENKERARGRVKDYCDSRRKEIAEKSSKYYYENKDKVDAYYAQPEVKAHRKEYMLKWRKKNEARLKKYRRLVVDSLRSNCQRRRAKKAQVTIGDPKIILEWEKKWKKMRRVKCYWCGNSFAPKECHSDHIIPIAPRKGKGGTHSIENLCISCSSCNHSKNDKTLAKWNSQISEPVLL